MTVEAEVIIDYLKRMDDNHQDFKTEMEEHRKSNKECLDKVRNIEKSVEKSIDKLNDKLDLKTNEMLKAFGDRAMYCSKTFLSTRMYLWITAFIIIGLTTVTGIAYNNNKTIDTHIQVVKPLIESHMLQNK